MSFFKTLSDMSAGYADALDAGQYKFSELPSASEPEPAPTVSLYNLLDHSPTDLKYIALVIRDKIREMEDVKHRIPDMYTSLCAWATILESAIKESERRDSLAWAEKTAKEINDTTK